MPIFKRFKYRERIILFHRNFFYLKADNINKEKNTALMARKRGLFIMMAINGKRALHIQSMNQSNFYFLFSYFSPLSVKYLSKRITGRHEIKDENMKRIFWTVMLIFYVKFI